MVGPTELVGQLRALGVRPGDVLLVHTSFRAVRPIEGGPLGLIAALRAAIGPTGTLLMPTMTAGDAVFDPRTTPTLDMGVVAETFWRLPGVLRSGHPGGSFAAAGPLAAELCAPQPLEPPHGVDSPVGRAWQHDAKVLLLGVGHDANTTLHLAESVLPVPYAVRHPCVVEVDGRAETTLIAETDHCCEGFARMDAWLEARALQTRGPVGGGEARLMRSQDVVAVALAHLEVDPLVFLCERGTGCTECDRAHASTTP